MSRRKQYRPIRVQDDEEGPSTEDAKKETTENGEFYYLFNRLTIQHVQQKQSMLSFYVE